MKTPFLVFASIALSLAASGCIVETSDPPVAVYPATPDGTLVLQWSIEGLANSAKCSQTISDSIEIVVSGPSGGVFTQTCAAFATTIVLSPGNYSATAALVDAAGTHRTTSVNIPPFAIYGGDSLSVPIDFPADSFR